MDEPRVEATMATMVVHDDVDVDDGDVDDGDDDDLSPDDPVIFRLLYYCPLRLQDNVLPSITAGKTALLRGGETTRRPRETCAAS